MNMEKEFIIFPIIAIVMIAAICLIKPKETNNIIEVTYYDGSKTILNILCNRQNLFMKEGCLIYFEESNAIVCGIRQFKIIN